MSAVPLLLFWIPALILAWVYVGYPLAAAIAGRVRPFQVAPVGDPPRRVTVGIAAYNEADQLAERIANILDQELDGDLEIVVASDGSTDGTSALVASIVAADERVRFLDLPRAGQTAIQNAIFATARGDVVVLTDAATRFEPGCLAALTAPFADPRVGCTTGRLRWIDPDRTETSRSEGAYWRYEQLVRRVESRAGWLTAVTGALLAVRASAFRPVPAHASMDHLLPLYVREEGLAALAVPEAVATDHGIAGLRDQLRNRSRTATRGIHSNLSMAAHLAPWRHPSAALAIWSHKLLRWATPWLAATAAGGALWLALGGSPVYVVPLVIGFVGIGLAIAGYVVRGTGRRAPRILSFPLAVTIVNLAFAIGWLNLLRGRRIEQWHRTEWAAEDRGRG